ncbi:MAG: acyltransferase [Treponema sp.]|jgi:hypothetical protein|nr:acyltransferase [Treponema sp.]
MSEENLTQTNVAEKPRHPFGYDVIRFIATFFIIAGHFVIYFKVNNLPINDFSYSLVLRFGIAALDLFFMISGATIHINNQKTPILKFYKKRWMNLFPIFYFCYIPLAIMRCISAKSFTLGLNPAKYLLSLIGFDGYLAIITPTYVIIGEWFLGMIIMVYLAYPLLRYFIKKDSVATWLVLLSGFMAVLLTDIGPYIDNQNIISCLFIFYCGMMFESYKQYITTPVKIVSAIIAVALFFFPVFGSNIGFLVIHCFFILVTLYFAFDFVDTRKKEVKNNIFVKIIQKGCKVSFTCYLIHHVTQDKLIPIVFAKVQNTFLTFIITTAVIIVLGLIVHFLFELFMKLLHNLFSKKTNS